jgi:hypothetical protein
MAAGEVWLLPHSGAEGSFAACVVLTHSSLNYRTCAGVLAACDDAIAAALEWAGSRVPHFIAYVDSGRCHASSMPDPHEHLPDVLRLGCDAGQRADDYSCYMVFSRTAGASDDDVAVAMAATAAKL